MIFKKNIFRERKWLFDFWPYLFSLPYFLKKKRSPPFPSVQAMRPKLTSRSKVIAGEWTLCMKKCPKGAIYLEEKEKRVTLFKLNLKKCSFCGECIKSAPKGGLEAAECSPHKIQSNEDFYLDLVRERDL